jgi:hypothetical protein
MRLISEGAVGVGQARHLALLAIIDGHCHTETKSDKGTSDRSSLLREMWLSVVFGSSLLQQRFTAREDNVGRRSRRFEVRISSLKDGKGQRQLSLIS